MAERKHKNLSFWVACVLFLLLTALFFTLSLSVAAELPGVWEYNRSRLSGGITFSTYEKIPNDSYTEHLSVCGELSAEFADGVGEVKPVLVNEHFFDVYGIHVGGSAVTAAHIAGKIPAAVISDKAARRLKLDADVIGQTISLWGKDFTVVGVYRAPSGLLRKLSCDIYDRVYLSYTSYDGYREVPIDTVAALKKSYSRKALPLLGMTGTDTNFYIENDLDIKRDMTANFADMFLALAAVVFAVIAYKTIKRMALGAYHKLRQESDTDYGFAVFRHNWRYLLARISAALLLAAVPVAILVFFPPKLVLPQSYIPYENIFDLSYYADVFTSRVQLANANLSLGNGYWQHLYDNTVALLFFLSALLIILFSVIMIRAKAMIRSKR